jgi:hypothetical protein
MRYLLLIAFSVASLCAVAQPGTGFANRMGENADRGPSLNKVEEKAKEALEEGDEYLAMDYYARVIAVDSNRLSALKGYTQATYQHGAYPLAKKTAQRALQLDPKDEAIQLLYAEILFREGAYEEAQARYTALTTGGSEQLTEKAQNGAALAAWAIEKRENSDFSKTAILLDTTINTEYSEYMNWPNNDGTFFFSSYRFPFKGDKGDRKRERRLVKIMQASPGKSGEGFDAMLTDWNQAKRHTLHPTFNEAGDLMYYAEGDFINSAEIRCALFMRRKINGGWSAPIQLQNVNFEGFTSTEPNVGRIPGTAGETLFFVSDRKEQGKGGRDIWCASINADGTVGLASNLGDINTAGDDVTPFYHNSTGTLYFSKIGDETMGGFDVYKSVGGGGAWAVSEHLEPPVNTASNDVFFTLTQDAHIAYLSSNRLGAKNISEEACCYDIFQVPLVKPKMVAVTFRKLTQDSLPNTTMRLYELVDGKPVLVDEAFKVPGAFYPFSVNPGKKYLVVAEKPGFKPDSVEFITPRTVWPGVMAQHLFLPEIKVDLVAKVYDKKTMQPIPGATARFVDLGPVGLLPKGEAPAPKSSSSVNTLSNDYNYNLAFNHQYKVYISKDGYTVDSTYVTTEGITETTTINRDLYLQRGVSLEAKVYDDMNPANPVPLTGVKFDLWDLSGPTPVKIASDIAKLDNRFMSFLEFGKKYSVIASKEGYSSDTVAFVVPTVMTKAFELIEQELNIHSLDLEHYLPIRLYFDNDEPNKRTLATTTTKLYSQTYFQYYPKRDSFISVFTDRLSGAERERASTELEEFFEDSLKGEWNRLRFFTEVLFEKLDKGEKVQIQIKGFASPRASSAYNKNLTARRIMSVMNHFSDFDGALLKQYISTGQLVVEEVSNGEDRSRPNVSDVYSDPRNSVFNVRASRERRVEIVGIQFDKY